MDMPVLRRNLLVAAIATVVACQSAIEGETCRAGCRLDIYLPEDPAQPPEFPERVRVAAGQELNLNVHGRRPGQARTVITFEQAAFQDETDTPLYSLDLVTGYNHYRLRDSSAGVCRPPSGCRFFVVNAGLLERPAATGSHGVLIIEAGE